MTVSVEKILNFSENISERFYIALYKKLSDPGLKSSSKQAMFLNLVFKSMNKDISDRRVKVGQKKRNFALHYPLSC